MGRCGQKTEVYSRVVGYYRPIAQWNKGKQEEFKARKVYDHPVEPAFDGEEAPDHGESRQPIAVGVAGV